MNAGKFVYNAQFEITSLTKALSKIKKRLFWSLLTLRHISLPQKIDFMM